MLEPKNSMWIIKYRPTKINDIIGDFKERIGNYLKEPSKIPHFLFYSKAPGCGKTTLALAIINELDCDALILNSSDDRKIEVIREKVKEFVMTQSTRKGMRRCVFLDEFDGMLIASQNVLRNLMETYASNVFFILTCNNVNKVIDALQSRCTKVMFAHPNKEEIYKYLINICIKEGMMYTNEGIIKLVDINYPSIRNCVSILQDLHTVKKPVTLENVIPEDEDFKILWDKLIEKDWKYIKKIVLKSDIDARDLNTYFWNKAVETENLRILQLCCRNEKDIAWGAKAEIIFVTSLVEMCK